MATADQIKSLIRSHYSEEPERFYALALQLAAHEAQQGHGALAHDIRDIVDKARRESGPRLLRFPMELTGWYCRRSPTQDCRRLSSHRGSWTASRGFCTSIDSKGN